jgi:K+/H+ antiporter YhaU regulatory subunit KhtT
MRQRGFTGRLAVTARNKADADLYHRAGAHVVLRPFIDAAEQGADALTEAWHTLARDIDWPVAFKEMRIKAGSVFAGQTIENIPLRSSTGVSIVAVSRAGRVFFNPESGFQLFPADRIVLMGPNENLKHAEELIHRIQEPVSDDEMEDFSLTEAQVAADSPMAGKTLSEIRFRQEYGSTVIGIRRGEERIIHPGPQERISEGDTLLVMGTRDSIGRLQQGLNVQ